MKSTIHGTLPNHSPAKSSSRSPFVSKEKRLMKHSTSYLTIALTICLLACSRPASAQVIPQAKTSAAPALTTFGVNTLVAWAGISSVSADGQTVHKVGYKYFYDGAWQTQQTMPYGTPPGTEINTTAAPALAQAEAEGDGLNHAYMAWRQDDGLVHYAVFDNSSNTFSTTDPSICSSCDTISSPALAGDGTTLYAAWTTSSGTIQYASYTDAAWNIYSVDVPGVSTKVAPALAAYGNDLYLAWVTEYNTIQVKHATLPLSSSGATWTTLPAPAALTSVAPSLAFIGSAFPKVPESLYVAWNTGSTIDFEYWSGSEWFSFTPSLPIPPGPLFTPAMNFFATGGACPNNAFFNVAYTLGGSSAGEIEWTTVGESSYESPFCEKF
jgi:hypothetical protein